MIYFPEHLRQKAIDRGIPAAEADDLWEQHCGRASSDGVDAGGRRWDKFLDAVCADLKDRVSLSRGESERAERLLHKRRLERQAADAADRAYTAQAVSLAAWLEGLRAQYADPSGEMLSPHELALATHTTPGPQDDPGAWIFAAMASRATKAPAAVLRDTGCPDCGMPVHSWVWGDRRYYGGRCIEHSSGVRSRVEATR